MSCNGRAKRCPSACYRSWEGNCLDSSEQWEAIEGQEGVEDLIRFAFEKLFVQIPDRTWGVLVGLEKGESVPSLAAGFTEVGDPFEVGAGEKESCFFYPPETPGTCRMPRGSTSETVGCGAELGTAPRPETPMQCDSSWLSASGKRVV